MKGWVLYDGDCAFCSRSAHFWFPVLRRRGFEIEALQADWVPDALGMSRDKALRDMRLLTTTGAMYAGADVYLYVARRIWWAWPFGIPVRAVTRFLTWWSRAVYRWLAANRYYVSGYCARKTR